jgi:uncharacterized protein (DUF4415 family)
MKKQRSKNIVKYKLHELPEDNKTDWKRVDAMTDQELEENAATEEGSLTADEEFWKVARLIMAATDKDKERVTIRIDKDILKWLKKEGRGYQSRINSILRAFMTVDKEHHQHHRKRS